MSWVIVGLVGFVSGLLGSLGMGAGAVLLLYLRIFGGVEQMAAQGINLIFFLPIAALSLLLHAKNKLIDWKAAGLCILTGLPLVYGGYRLAGLLGTGVLSKLFACLLFFIGLRELFSAKS